MKRSAILSFMALFAARSWTVIGGFARWKVSAGAFGLGLGVVILTASFETFGATGPASTAAVSAKD